MLDYRRASSEVIVDLELFLQKDKIRFDSCYKMGFEQRMSIQDFIRIVTLGVGSFGKVILVKEIKTKQHYALKQLLKEKIVQLEQVDQTRREKKILQSLNFPFLIYIKYYFHDNCYIYFVLPFIKGGELFSLLKQQKKFDEEHSKFYAAQIVLALEYLQYMDLVYRDLKPENVLIDVTGYIRIADFGFCKKINGRTYTLCGTPEYLAPEVILNKGYGYSVDWWAFGVFVYEMNSGVAPFRHWDPFVLYDQICGGVFTIPQTFSKSLKDFVKSLIETDITKRLGNLKDGVAEVKQHRWFRHITWMAILNRKMKPPVTPEMSDPEDTSNFISYKEEADETCDVDEFTVEFRNF